MNPRIQMLPILALLLCGCETTAPIGPATNIRAAQQGVTAEQQASVQKSAGIAEIKRLTGASEGKAQLLLRWMRLQDQRRYERP